MENCRPNNLSLSPIDDLKISNAVTESYNRARFERIDLLSAIDRHIKDSDDETKRPGWSVWALLGALGTIIWLIPSQYNDRTDFRLVGLVLLFVQLCIEVFLLIFIRHRPSSMPFRSQFRFKQPYDQFGFSREYFLFLICRNSILILINNNLDGSIQVETFNLYYGLSTLGCAFGILMSFKKEPTGQRTAISTKTFEVLDFLQLICAIWAVFLVVVVSQRLRAWPKDYISFDVKLGLLAACAISIIQMIVLGEKERHAINKLKAIARDLAFFRITTEEATAEVDSQLSGITAHSMIKQLTKTLEKPLTEFEEALIKLESNIHLIEQILICVEKKDYENNDKWKYEARRAGDLLAACAAEISSLETRTRKANDLAKKICRIFNTCKKESLFLPADVINEAITEFERGSETQKKLEELQKIHFNSKQRYLILTREEIEFEEIS